MTQVAEILGRNVASRRKALGLTTRGLSERLEKLGHRIANSSLSKVESGQRLVSAEDLVALAIALQVNTDRLLMPDRAGMNAVSLTPEVTTTGHRAWAWADGLMPMLSTYDDDATDAERIDDFRRSVRPVDHRLRAEHPAYRAVQRLATQVDALLVHLADGGRDVPQELVGVGQAFRRVEEEVSELLRETISGLPTIYRVKRPDDFAGVEAGVRFYGGEAVAHEHDHAEALDLFRKAGYTITPYSVKERLAMVKLSEDTIASIRAELEEVHRGDR
jgi:transcriptional regulator with XRE-family HTH domain